MVAGVFHSIYDDYCDQDLFDYTEGSLWSVEYFWILEIDCTYVFY